MTEPTATTHARQPCPPGAERLSHDLHARRALQLDALIDAAETRVLYPMERTPRWERSEPPETFPRGF